MLNETARYKLMADKLMVEVAAGRLSGEFSESFVPRVRDKLKAGRELTVNEVKWLEKLFEG